MYGNFQFSQQQIPAPVGFDFLSDPLPPWSIDSKTTWQQPGQTLAPTPFLETAPKPQEFEVPVESWLETPLLPEAPADAQQPLERVSSHGSTFEDSHERSAPLGKDTVECPSCLGDHSKFEDVTSSEGPVKTGRPVVDRVMSHDELLKEFRTRLMTNFSKINEKFARETARTDKYRTMLVRMIKRVLSEVVSLIGIASYAKSNKINRYMPEFHKKFEQMRKSVLALLQSKPEFSHLSASLDDDSQCLVHLSFSFYTLYVSKDRCQEMAASVGI